MLKLISRLIFSCILLAMMGSALAAADFLEPEQAFQFSSKQIAPDRIAVTYQIADGYYMYRERFKLEAVGATLGTPVFPKGAVHFDETFQKDVETFRKSVTIEIPILSLDPAQAHWNIKSRGQGCSDQGLCYAPIDSTQSYDSSAFKPGSSPPPASGQHASANNTDQLETTLQSGRLILILPLFFILGLGLAFTPCVLPMVPILSSIIVGEGEQVSRRRGFALSLSYSLGMALVYTALGVTAGLLGEGLAATLQNPWVIGAFGLLLVVLSLSMFDVYQLQLPQAIQNRLWQASGSQRAGKLVGVFAMGAISGLLIGPCVAAPLASALLYISRTHDVVIGGSALFMMAVGMSVPLLLVGVSAGSLLPKAGRWMVSIKQLFGVLMLALALWLVSPFLPSVWQMLGWTVLLIGYGVFLIRHTGWFPRATAVVLLVLGSVELVGLGTGGRDTFAPLAHLTGAPQQHVQFARVRTVQELDHALADAKASGKTVMLEFNADWCVSCKEMEKLTYTDPRVASRMATLVLLQADVTDNSDSDKALLKRFGVLGPPSVIFFNSDATEVGRVIGYQEASQFDQSLQSFTKS